MQVIVPFITLVLGVFLGTGFALYIRRPKLRVTGSGSGVASGRKHRTAHVQVQNRPGLFGLTLPESVLLGKQLHGRFEKGLTVDRNPANDCTAVIHDKTTGEHIAPLYWRTVTDSAETFPRRIVIACGESSQLMLFARLEDEPGKYFIFAPEGSASPVPRVRGDDGKFEDTHEFVVHITYSYGRQKLSLDVAMRKGYDGRLSYETTTSSGSF